MRHTPGPWTRQGQNIHHLQYDEPLDARNIIATLPNDNPETVHNGHLIAAAPDLLQALREITAYYANDCRCTMSNGYVCVVHRTTRVINTAEGRTP